MRRTQALELHDQQQRCHRLLERQWYYRQKEGLRLAVWNGEAIERNHGRLADTRARRLKFRRPFAIVGSS